MTDQKLIISKPVANGDISFNVGNNEEILLLKENGDIFVKGRLIENDKEVVDGLRTFLRYWSGGCL